VKYGREEKVQQLLEQYRNFVSRNRIFQEFNKAYIDMQQVVEEYKREGDVGEYVTFYLMSKKVFPVLL
jgi:nesprin-1